MVSPAPSVAVIGGGVAGLAASCTLAQTGFRVTVFERRPFLGGRASSYLHPATGEVVDNCQHVLFGSCTNLLAFYRSLGIEQKIRWFDQMTFLEPGGRRSLLKPSFLPCPLDVLPAFFRFPFLAARDKLAIVRALTVLFTRRVPDDGSTFQDWLARHGQTEKAMERFWKPILVSALSEDLDRIAVPYAAQVVRVSMSSLAAHQMGVPRVPLGELYGAAQLYLDQHGGVVRLREGAQCFMPSAAGVRVKLGASQEEFDYAVLAVPAESLAPLLPDGAESEELREKIGHFETSPITGVHLWFDRQITELDHAVLLDRTIQWIFHKSRLLTAGAETSDADNERAAGRHREARPSYIELVISSSKSLVERSRQETIDLALRELKEFFPAAREAKLVKATVIKELNATFSPRPGIDRYRPPATTGWPRVFLAGDWTATGWPATMEGAARSGYRAAQEIQRREGVRESPLAPDVKATGLMHLGRWVRGETRNAAGRWRTLHSRIRESSVSQDEEPAFGPVSNPSASP